MIEGILHQIGYRRQTAGITGITKPVQSGCRGAHEQGHPGGGLLFTHNIIAGMPYWHRKCFEVKDNLRVVEL